MKRDIVIKGRSLGGSSDLTLLAPIKPGFVESLESVTYKTRIKRVLEALHGARMGSHEYATARLLSDSVERVGAIHSVRVAVLEPEDKVLLAVSFDGSWEAYVRVLWDKVGTLLDLIFCGTLDYVTAAEHSFEEWHEWALRVQVETGFYYGAAETSARDALYQRRVERMRVRGEGGNSADARESAELQAVLPSAEEAVERFVDNQREPVADDPQVVQVQDTRMVRERIRNGLQGLAALYRLVDLHRPMTPDGNVLRRAAIDLLREFVKMRDDNLINQQLGEVAATRFERQLAWLFPDESPAAVPRPAPPPAEAAGPIDPGDLHDIQGGIVRTYEDTTHGLVLMLSFDSPATARDFLAWAGPRVTRADQTHVASPGVTFFNLGLTPAGLRAAGMDEDTLALFPEEFLQGMAARAGLLGDVRNNHPRRWRRPSRFTGLNTPPGTESIEIETVHAVLQLRCGVLAGSAARAAIELSEPAHPLRSAVEELQAANPRLAILAAQPMTRQTRTTAAGATVINEHFGYADGNGQPEVLPGPTPFDLNRIHLGELVLGHANAADMKPDLDAPGMPEPSKVRLRWMANGSFLVVRKYRQFVDRLAQAVSSAGDEMAEKLILPKKDCEAIVYAKMMGRWPDDGMPLVPGKPGTSNNFLYRSDPQGALCPLHAHIRRAHPRMARGSAARPPRLMRRSMSYGPKYVAGTSTAGAERGLVFMAYNASIGEQFEVVQRWLVGGNSTGASSSGSCPIVGVPENGVARHFRFEHAGHVFRVQLEGTIVPFEEVPTATQLEWGLYLFVPSLSALHQLHSVASTAASAAPAASVPWQLARGRRLIEALRRLEAGGSEAAALDGWKGIVEDPEAIDRLDSASMWAAIRNDHGGVLKTPYGTLVASRELLSQVFQDPHARYSVCGQLARMKRSFGEIYLGLDAGPAYQQQSDAINKEIMRLTDRETFDIAFGAARRKIDAIVQEAKTQARTALDTRFDVAFDAREVVDEVLAALCDAWFGLADDPAGRFVRGGADWAWQPGKPPPYPGHFTAMSRYMFQPIPGAMVAELGERYGQALRASMRLFVADHRARGTTPKVAEGSSIDAPIALAIFNHEFGADDDFVARTMVGVLMGFNPPILGAVQNVIRELQHEHRFGALRAALAGRTGFADAEAVLREPMMKAAHMRPMPQVGWRTALKPHRLGMTDADAVEVAVGDKLVLSLVSGTQQSLADGQPEGKLMFGGDRSAAVHPTHACPGYEAAIGAMLGTLTALLTRPETVRPGATALSFTLEGPADTPPPASPPAVPRAGLEPVLPKRKGLVLAWGDSWLDYRFPAAGDRGQDLRDWLQKFGYEAPKEFCRWTSWPKAKTMADAPARFCQFVRDQVQTSSLPLVAILLSAGGNDSTGDTLAGLINLKAPAKPVLDDALLKKHLDGIEANYKTILKAIGAALAASGADTVPVIVHGYDYPYPDGRQGLRLWLDEPFTDRGYDPVNDRQARVKAMRDLIDQLNVRLASLPGVHYIDLRGTIETTWPANPTEAWDNDLHPEDEPFRLFALKIDAEIDRLAAPTSVAVAAAPGPGATPSALPRKPRKPARP